MVAIDENTKSEESPQLKPGSRFILLIDDDPLSNYLSKKLLVHFGAMASIKAFVNATNALQFITDLKPAAVDEVCILLDLQMVGMDGVVFLENLKRVKPFMKLRIYLVTGSMPIAHLDQLKSFSIAGFFLKPLSKGNVKEVLMPLKPLYFNVDK